MIYRDAIKKSMENLSRKKDVLFLGYNVNFGSFAYETIIDVPMEKRLETPLAENLMIGLAIGVSLEGYRPVVFFERHDFMLNALDGIVNHMDKIETLSRRQFKTPAIIRAIVGSRTPINPGIQHTQDFTKAFKEMLSFPIYEPLTSQEVLQAYEDAEKITRVQKKPVMIIERKELYHQNFNKSWSKSKK